MKKIILFLLIITISISAKTFMWKVEGGKSTLHLLGSIHVAKPSLYPLNKKITDAFNNSKNLVVEADVTKNQFAAQMKVMKLGMYSDKTLKDVLTAKIYTDLSKRAKEIGLPMIAINRMKPWLASLSLVMYQMKKLGYDPNSGIDLFFLKKAKKEKKTIIELESADFQLELLAGFGEKLDILGLKLMLKDWDKSEDILNKMFNEWQKGEKKTLLDLTFKNIKEYPEFKIYYKKLLFDRNIEMATKIDKMLKTPKNSYFIVVGGGHLIGKGGVVELLRKKGYKVTQE